MSRIFADRPGLIVFPAGVAFVLSAVGLGFYLASQAPEIVAQPLYHQLFGVDEADGVGYLPAGRHLLGSLPLLMWLAFGLGSCLTLIGLRLLMRPNLDSVPSKPIGSIRDVLEDPA